MKRLFSLIKTIFLISLLFGVFSSVISISETDTMQIVYKAGALTLVAIGVSFLIPQKGKGIVTHDFTEGLCPAIQTSMIETFKNNAPQSRRTKVGFLQAIKSHQNTQGFEILPLDDGSGKIKTVKIKGIQRGCDSDIVTTCVDDADRTCVGNNIIAPWEDTIGDFSCIESPDYLFEESDMRKLCESDDAYRASVINTRVDSLMVKLNKLLITDQAANFGQFYDGSTIKNVTLLKANGDPAYLGESDILEQFENLELSVKPLVIGSGKLGQYVRQLGIGCCNDGGLDLSQAGNLDFYRDKYVEDIIGADEFIGLAPGHLMLVTLNTNQGTYRRVHDHYINDTFVDPWTGIKLDMDVIYDPCKRTYYMKLRLKWMLYRMPIESFSYCDELYGTNGTLNFKALQSA